MLKHDRAYSEYEFRRKFVCDNQRWSRGHKARSQGQGHKKISRPRTDPVEAKDQGHRRKCSPKKSLQNFFSGDLKKKNVFKKFLRRKNLQNFFSGDLYLRKPKKVFANFPQGFWRFPTKFQRFKNSTVLEPRTGQFSRT